MTVTRRAAVAVAALCATTMVLAGCGGSDEEPVVEPTSGASSTASADPDGLTPEQREVADAVQAYSDASLARGSDPIKGSAVEPLLTPELVTTLERVAPPSGEKRDYIGTVTLLPATVTVNGDTATYTGCQDGSQAYSVKEGETTPGVGSSNVGYTRLDFTLVRQDDRWLIDDPQGEPASSC